MTRKLNPTDLKEGSTQEAIESAVLSHRKGELDEWELHLIATRHQHEVQSLHKRLCALEEALWKKSEYQDFVKVEG